MAVDIKETYKQMREIKKEVWKVEKEIEAFKLAVKQANGIIEKLGSTPDRELLLADAQKALVANQEQLALHHQQHADLEALLPKKEVVGPKYDPSQHPILKKTLEDTQPALPVVFNTGDLIEAKWEDGQWYKAKINSIMGSTSKPIFNVRFIEYDDSTLTVGREDIRPYVVEPKKRKAEVLKEAAPTARTSSPIVIQGAPTVNPALKKEEPKDTDLRPAKKRMIGGEKALERKKDNWQNFVKKGPGKRSQKESMFRSGTTVNSKVGFTGSGAGMSATQKRVRPTYGKDEY